MLNQELHLDRRARGGAVPPPIPPGLKAHNRSKPQGPPPVLRPPALEEETLIDLASSPEQTDAEVRARPASLWRRLGSALVDASVVLGAVWLFLQAALLLTGHSAPQTELDGLDRWVWIGHALLPVLKPMAALCVLLALTYTGVFSVAWQGRTLGRRLFGIRLVDARGLPPTPVRAAFRTVAAVLSFAFFFGGYWLSLFDRRGQTLHDKLTSTFVVR